MKQNASPQQNQPTTPTILVSGRVMEPQADDVGFDLYAAQDTWIPFHKLSAIKTNTRVMSPPGIWYQIFPRSSITSKGLLCPLNVIDPGYTGELSLYVFRVGVGNNDTGEAFIEQGTRIAQLVFFRNVRPRIEIVSEFPQTQRGERGFGSTGAR